MSFTTLKPQVNQVPVKVLPVKKTQNVLFRVKTVLTSNLQASNYSAVDASKLSISMKIAH